MRPLRAEGHGGGSWLLQWKSRSGELVSAILVLLTALVSCAPASFELEIVPGVCVKVEHFK
eukprot:8958667-Pyramimonas_sp.AAC.1